MIKKVFSVLLCLMFAFTLLTGCTPPTITIFTADRQQPSDCISTFFSCLSRDDYAGADSCLCNLTTLGLGETMPEGLYAQLYQYLRDSRSYTVVDQTASVLNAEITLDLTVLDFRRIEATLSEAVTNKVADIEFQGLEVDDAQLAQLIETTLSELMLAPEAYYSTERFTVPLYYIEDVWQMECSDDLYSALFGYIV